MEVRDATAPKAAIIGDDLKSQRPAASTFRTSEPGKLLLIDTSIGQCAVLQRILNAHGFSVLACSDLSKAPPKIATQQFEYAVLDLRLHGRDGLRLVRSLREALPKVRIVVVTDADSFATVVLTLRAGADGFVAKPADKGELIDALLDQAPPLPPVPQTLLGLPRIHWEHIVRVYEQCDRNKTRAAAHLGMHRRSLQRFVSKRAPLPRATAPKI